MRYYFTMAGIISVILALFKSFGVIGWSWGWVFAPIWITASFMFVIIVMILCLIGHVTKHQNLTIDDINNALQKLNDMLDDYTKNEE
jgi:hypothetical protein